MRAIWAVFCLGWLAIAAAASFRAALPLMSADEAVSTAQWFAQKANLPLTGAPKAEFRGSERGFLTPPSWDVRFAASGRCQIDAETGQVLAFEVFSRAAARQARTDEQAISEGEAVEIATQVAEAMGLPPDAVRRSSTLMGVAGPADLWSITWERRTPSGIPFNDDQLTVDVGAASGQPSGAYMRWLSRLPESMEVKITRERAVQLGCSLATKRGPLLGKPTATAELKIVHPNGHWTNRPVRHIRYDGPTRLAWVVDVKRERAADRGMVFWVDAADGSLLGGREVPYGWFRSGG